MCGGIDVQQFKGVFVRHLMYALPSLGSLDSAKSPQAQKQAAFGVAPTANSASAGAYSYLQSVLLDNAASLLSNATQTDPTTGEMQFGPLWQVRS